MSVLLKLCLLFVVGCILQKNFAQAQNFGSCRDGTSCMELNQCPQLYALLQNPNLSTTDRNYLSRSQCGFVNGKVLVCCSGRQRTNTPSGNPSRASTLPKAPECGISLTDRILGGVTTHILEFPWMALLEYTKPDNTKGHHCGGALISNRYVLTAAHCIAGVPANWRLTGVRLGEWDTTTNPDCDVDQRGKRNCVPEILDVGVESRIVHPQYVQGSNDQLNDIALLRLSRAVTSADHIKPICLPSSAALRDQDFIGTVMDVAGWGRTETELSSTLKLKAEVSVWDLGNCSATYRRSNRNLDTTQICAGGEEGVDSCRGDSGGPLMVQQLASGRNVYFLIGVVSYGPTPCGLRGWPGVYTKVGAFIDWIQDNVQ